MILKRIYAMEKSEHRDETGEFVMVLKRDKAGQPVVIGVEVKSLGASPNQHFTPELVTTAIAQGWLAWVKGGRGTLELIGANMTVPYKVLRDPGYYCCHCKKRQSDGSEARMHIAREHAGKASPDPQNPSGYERINYFDCVEVNPREVA